MLESPLSYLREHPIPFNCALTLDPKKMTVFTDKRAGFDRRCSSDGRRLFESCSPFYKGPEKRKQKDRRSRTEQRISWVRVSNWSSKNLESFEKLLNLGRNEVEN